MDRRRKTIGSQAPSIRSRRKTRKSKRRSTNTFEEIPGLFYVKISPSLQSVLSCRIGINITNDERWVYVDKQVLLSELKGRRPSINKTSGFSRIQTELKAFPEDYILVGSYGGDDFLVCLSEYAKKVCENWMEEEKKLLREGLLRLLSRETFRWQTLGSDKEIDQHILNRSPFCVQLEFKIGFDVKFDLRLPNDCKDGYAEFVDTRTIYDIVLSRRVDRSCQVGNLKVNKHSQTLNPPSTHKGIQYKYTSPQIKESKEFSLSINKWFQECYNDLSSVLLCNAKFDIYKSDYLDLPNQKTRHPIENPNIIVPFFDSTVCHGKVVNCIAWNAIFSGIIAAAYGNFCTKIIVKEQPKHPDYNSRKINDHLVLIWDASKPRIPLFYLHAHREITAMNFCPYNPNILIGGSADGQIVVWDLGGKLDYRKPEIKIQTTEVLMLITEKMSWMKYPPDEHNIYPCVISKLETCHKSHITVIKWIPPEYYIDKQGEIVECQENEEHMQFLTTALDDSILLVWDLSLNNTRSELHPKKRKDRLASKRPETLDETKSPYSKLNFNFKPVFRLNFIDSETKGMIYVNDFSFKMGSFCYQPLNDESVGDILQRTKFIRVKEKENFTLEKNLLVATGFGDIYNCSWTSHNFDQGLEVNWQNINTISFSSYHDGPIYHMQRNPYHPDIMLTTGGRVFSIWDYSSENKKPLIWRKGSIRYVMAVWGSENPLAIIAAREDAKIELWDFDEDSKIPLRMTKLIGDHLLSVFVNNSLNHVMKNTCLTTDSSGTLSIYSTPSKLFVSGTGFSRKRGSIKNIQYRREVLKYWNDYVKRKRPHLVEDEECDIKEEEILKEQSRQSMYRKQSTLQKTLSLRSIKHNNWKIKEYTRMYNILIEKHRINLNNMEINEGLLKEFMESRTARQQQIDKYIAKKKIIYHEEKVKLLDRINQETYIATHFPKEIIKEIKVQYFESYKNIETDTKNYIENHRYRYFFDYQAMIIQAKRNYSYGVLSNPTSMFSQDTRDYSNNIPQVGRKSMKFIVAEFDL